MAHVIALRLGGSLLASRGGSFLAGAEGQTINRFAFPGIRTHSEFIYYLDNRAALEVLAENQKLPDIHPQMEDALETRQDSGGSCSQPAVAP